MARMNPTPLSDRTFYVLLAILAVWAVLTPTGKALVRSFWQAVQEARSHGSS